MSIFTFSYANSQCKEDPRNLKLVNQNFSIENIDFVKVSTYSIDEDSIKSRVSSRVYSNIMDGLARTILIEDGYSSNREIRYTFDLSDKIISKSDRNFDYSAISDEDFFFYDVNGCDSLILSISYDIRDMGDGDSEFKKIIQINGLERTEFLYSGKELLSKEIMLYNSKGQIIEFIKYSERYGADLISEDSLPTYSQKFSYNEMGEKNRMLLYTSKGEIEEIWVFQYDDNGNLIKEIGRSYYGKGKIEDFTFKNVQDFANKIDEKVKLEDRGQEYFYKYDEGNNILEISTKVLNATFVITSFTTYEYFYSKK